MEYIGYVGMLLAVIGTFFNARANRVCFYIWMVSNIIFVVLSVQAAQWPQVGLFTYNFATCFLGLRNWKKEA
jgi:nicotinamide riboside transporter PnuC